MSEAIKEAESKELKIVQFDEFENKLVKFKDQFEKVVYDLNDKKQEKQARSDRLEIGKVVSALDAAHKKIKSPLLAKTKLLDTERKRIKDELQGVQDCIKNQIEKHETAIKQKAAELQERISTIINIGYFEESPQLTSEQLKWRLKQVQDIAIDNSFVDRKGDAAIAKDETIQALTAFINDAEHAERLAAQAEVERLAQIEKDKKAETARIEKEAKEKAEADAQKAINDANQRAIDAEAKAALDASEKERIEKQRADEAEAESKRLKEKADNDAKQAVIDQEVAVKAAEDKIKADKEEADRVEAKAKADREADIEHRKGINNAAANGFIELGFSEMVAKSAVTAIAKGFIPGVTIHY